MTYDYQERFTEQSLNGYGLSKIKVMSMFAVLMYTAFKFVK